MNIRIDTLEGVEIHKLLREHHEDMLKHSPPESVHALDLSSLKSSDVTFWSGWIDGELAGCGALKKISDNHAEIKSMRTSHQFLRKGVAAKLLTHIIKFAKSQHYNRISLETGTADVFLPAQNLYNGFGFEDCEPFSNYEEDPHSMFLTKEL
jgi:putative acetyltransferase